MRFLAFWLTGALLLSACDPNTGMPIDGRKSLDSIKEGPKVLGVQDTLTKSAQRAEEQGDFRQAAQFYQQALEKNPDNQELALALADSYRRSGDYDRANALYDQLIKRDASAVEPKEGKALALIAKGDFDAPAPLLESVMNADPKRWKTLNGLGILFVTRNMYPEAQQYFNEALKFSANNPSVLNNLGLAQALNKEFDPAIASLSQASALTPADSSTRKQVDLNLAMVYATAGRLDQAEDIAAQYYSGAEFNNNMGLYAHLAKDDQLAKAYLNMALTESKVFYAKAWDNLQSINSGAPRQMPKVPLTNRLGKP